jgi:hypothetical protein
VGEWNDKAVVGNSRRTGEENVRGREMKRRRASAREREGELRGGAVVVVVEVEGCFRDVRNCGKRKVA